MLVGQVFTGAADGTPRQEGYVVVADARTPPDTTRQQDRPGGRQLGEVCLVLLVSGQREMAAGQWTARVRTTLNPNDSRVRTAMTEREGS